MNVREGDTVEMIYHMSNRGKVLKVYTKPVTAGTGAGALSKRKFIIFESFLDGKIYDVAAQSLRLVRE